MHAPTPTSRVAEAAVGVGENARQVFEVEQRHDASHDDTQARVDADVIVGDVMVCGGGQVLGSEAGVDEGDVGRRVDRRVQPTTVDDDAEPDAPH